MVRKVFVPVVAALAAVAALTAGAAVGKSVFPDQIALPNGFQPEGIATGYGHTLYAGSLADGRILRIDARTGARETVVPGAAGQVSVGLKLDRRSGYLFVAGGPTGTARVVNARTGQVLATHQLAPAGNFVNDVIVTRTGAYFTVSSQATLYRLPLGPGGSLAGAPQALPLGGQWQQVPMAFNANGIAATPNGKWLVVVNSTLGALFRVDPATGVATRIDLGGASVSNGDGLLLHGRTLYIVRNRLNLVAVIRLSGDLSSGVYTRDLTSPLFRVPTTVARIGASLYLPNARFGTPPTPTTDYDIVRIGRR